MRILLPILIMLALGAGLPERNSGPVGRYQVVPADITYLGGAPDPVHSAIKLDTTTGRCWILQCSVSNGPLARWSLIHDLAY